MTENAAFPGKNPGDVDVCADGADIHVVQDGRPGAPAIVLIHGLGGSSRWWDPVVRLLDQAYRVVRVDLLGFGRSGKPAVDTYAMPEHARRIAGVLDQLGLPEAVIVGHSTGGVVATALAEQRPDLVAGVVLIDIGPRMSAFMSSGVVGALVSAPVIGRLLWALQTDGLVRKAMSSAFSKPGFTIPQELVDDTRATTYYSLHATDEASTGYLEQQPLPDRLASIGKRVLVIFGEDDRRFRASSAQEYRAVAGAEVVVLPGVGHSPMQEDPEQTARLISAFAQQTPDDSKR
jgi:pimeloyl-ACP methyl ester carboxylesterase